MTWEKLEAYLEQWKKEHKAEESTIELMLYPPTNEIANMIAEAWENDPLF